MSSFFGFGRKSQPKPERVQEGQQQLQQPAEADSEGADCETYLKYLEEANQSSVELASLRDTGCVAQGRDREGMPILFLAPHLGMPRVYLEGEVFFWPFLYCFLYLNPHVICLNAYESRPLSTF